MTDIFSYDDIKTILPYRKPMLLLDRIKVESETRAIGLKMVSMDESFFQGHFPGHPIMPGVLQIEAMFQLCHFLAGDKLDPQRTQDVYLKKLSKVKFRKPVSPGDRILIEVELLSIEDGCAEFKALTRIAAGLACQANITVSVRPKVKPDFFPLSFTEHDYSETAAFNTLSIMNTIPHRFPFLYADYVTEIEGNHICVIKNLTGNEPIFRGYKEDYSVLPSSVQCEIIAQAGAINMLSKPANKGKIAVFAAISEFEVFHPVLPGDQLVCDIEVPGGDSKFGRGIGEIHVGEKVVSTISLSFAIV